MVLTNEECLLSLNQYVLNRVHNSALFVPNISTWTQFAPFHYISMKSILILFSYLYPDLTNSPFLPYVLINPRFYYRIQKSYRLHLKHVSKVYNYFYWIHLILSGYFLSVCLQVAGCLHIPGRVVCSNITMHATCPASLVPRHLPTLIKFAELYRSLSPS